VRHNNAHLETCDRSSGEGIGAEFRCLPNYHPTVSQCRGRLRGDNVTCRQPSFVEYSIWQTGAMIASIEHTSLHTASTPSLRGNLASGAGPGNEPGNETACCSQRLDLACSHWSGGKGDGFPPGFQVTCMGWGPGSRWDVLHYIGRWHPPCCLPYDVQE
jgi:hypothetical protein